MYWNLRTDGCAAVYTDDAEHAPYEPGGSNEIIIEPVITAFTPAKGTTCPECGGGELTHRRATDNRWELYCAGCHSVLAHIELSIKVYG